jgi:hypothetical protein
MKTWKLILTPVAALLIHSATQAQSTVRETRLSVMDADRMAFSVEFNYDQKVVQDAWDKKMDEFKLKGKNQKGVTVYEGVKFPDIHFENIDLFSRVDKVDKGRCSLTICVSKGYGNFITSADNQLVDNSKNFLGTFITYTDQYKLKLDIKAQEDLITDTQKSYDKLIEDGKKLTEQLEKNKIDQENKVKELEAGKKLLEELRAKVK